MISTDYSPDVYNGDGTLDTYDFNWRILAKSDLRVSDLVVATGVVTELELDSDFTVEDAMVNTDEGGEIVLTGGNLATGHRLVIERFTARRQQTDLSEGTPFSAETVEQMFDRLTMIAQEHDWRDRQALKFAPTSTTVDKNVPDPGDDGQPLVWADSELVNADGSADGPVTLDDLPTSDPAVEGQLWNDSGTVKVSAG